MRLLPRLTVADIDAGSFYALLCDRFGVIPTKTSIRGPNWPAATEWHAGLVPLMELAEQAGLSQLLSEHVRFPTNGSSRARPTRRRNSPCYWARLKNADGDLDSIRGGDAKGLTLWMAARCH